MSHPIWAVVLAAGSGHRFGTSVPKQYQPLAGRTVLEHSLDICAGHNAVQGIVLVLAAADPHWPGLAYRCSKTLYTVTGGDARAHSVIAGLRRVLQLDAGAWALVHDAARACLSAELLSNLISAAASDAVGGLLAIPVQDTLKQVCDGRVAATLDRGALWQAQTPQLFPAAGLLRACELALARGQLPTDEAAAMEATGLQPRIVAGAAYNFKITTPEDLARAQQWLRGAT